MTTDLNPVQAAIRDHIAEHYPAWSRDREPLATRSGLRYRGFDAAFLVRDVLRECGLRVYDDGSYFRGVFVSPSGKRVTREALSGLIRPAIAGHEDAALVDTIGTSAFFEAVADLVPNYDGPIAFTRARPTRPATHEETRAAVEGFLGEIVEEPMKLAEVFEIYAEYADADEVPVLGKTTFYRVAEETGRVRRVRRRDGAYFLRRWRLLSDAAVEVLTRSAEILGRGPRTRAEAEAYADAAEREILVRAPADRPAVLNPRVVALPWQVAYAVAGVDDAEVNATFGRMARFHLERHEDDRDAIAAVAVALRAGDPDGLVSHIRMRVASAIETENAATST